MESQEVVGPAQVDEHMPPRRTQALFNAKRQAQGTGQIRFVICYDQTNYDDVPSPEQNDVITDIVFPDGKVIDEVAKRRPAGL